MAQLTFFFFFIFPKSGASERELTVAHIYSNSIYLALHESGAACESSFIALIIRAARINYCDCDTDIREFKLPRET